MSQRMSQRMNWLKMNSYLCNETNNNLLRNTSKSCDHIKTGRKRKCPYDIDWLDKYYNYEYDQFILNQVDNADINTIIIDDTIIYDQPFLAICIGCNDGFHALPKYKKQL